MDDKTLYAIATAAVRRKRRWCPPTIEADELLQEACVAILQAERDSNIRLDDIELQRAAELHLVKVMRKESNRRTVPSVDLSGGRAEE